MHRNLSHDVDIGVAVFNLEPVVRLFGLCNLGYRCDNGTVYDNADIRGRLLRPDLNAASAKIRALPTGNTAVAK